MFHDIKSLLNRNIKQAGLNKQVDAINIIDIFNKFAPSFLPEKIARQVQAIYIREKILTLQCSSSLIMQELRYRDRYIIKILNQKAGREVVEKIRYTT